MNEFNTSLEKYGLLSFKHRFISRASSFIFKIINFPTSPQILSDQLKHEIKEYNLRKMSYLKFSVNSSVKVNLTKKRSSCGWR